MVADSRMIFFASKLIQAVFAPLAISCILIVFSIAALWRRQLRISLGCNLAALAILALLGNSFIERALFLPLEMRNLPPRQNPAADAIVVLGGVTEPAFPPQPMTHLGCSGDRLVYAAKLYQEGKAQVVVVSGGTPQSFPTAVEPPASAIAAATIFCLGLFPCGGRIPS